MPLPCTLQELFPAQPDSLYRVLEAHAMLTGIDDLEWMGSQNLDYWTNCWLERAERAPAGSTEEKQASTNAMYLAQCRRIADYQPAFPIFRNVGWEAGTTVAVLLTPEDLTGDSQLSVIVNSIVLGTQERTVQVRLRMKVATPQPGDDPTVFTAPRTAHNVLSGPELDALRSDPLYTSWWVHAVPAQLLESRYQPTRHLRRILRLPVI